MPSSPDGRATAIRNALFSRWALYALVLAVAAVEACSTFVRHGDAAEYVITSEAWINHASPEIRAADLESTRRFRTPGLDVPIETLESKDGATYASHFWLYSLLCVFLKGILRLIHANELWAFALTNAAAFVAATCFAWSLGHADASRRRAFVVLAAIAPAFWYIRWSSPETFSWACVVASLACLDANRYVLAAALAGLASLHNPPIAFLGGASVIISLTTRRLATIGLTVLAASTSLLAALFYWIKVGVPSPLMKTATSFALVSPGRTFSLLFDLNQGLFPYAPVLVVGVPIAIALGLRRRNTPTLAVSAALVLMVIAMQTQKNWNGGCAGIIRYGVWTLPVLAWLVVRESPNRRYVVPILCVEVAWQIASVAAHRDADEDYTTHHRLARLVLDHAPSLYNPDPEIFVERSIHTELPQSVYPELLPVVYTRDDGEITKMLVTPEAFPMIRRRYEVRSDYRPILEHAGDGPLAIYHYVNPPPGAVRRSFPPMLISYAGCDDVVPERNGRSCLGDSRVTIHNLERVPGHVKVEMTFERSVSPCEIDVEVQGRRDRVNVVPGGFGTPYATTLIVPGREDVTMRFASTDAPERPTGAHHLLRNVALVRTDAP